MSQKNTNLFIPFSVTSGIFVIGFIISFFVLLETNIFGTSLPENSPEPMTYLGGLLGTTFVFAIILSLIAFFILSLYYDLNKYLYYILIAGIGIGGMMISIILLRTLFDVTNFFEIVRIDPFTRVTNECKASVSCVSNVNAGIFSFILGLCLGIILTIVSFLLLKRRGKLTS